MGLLPKCAVNVRRARFHAGSSTPLHLIGVELEKAGDDFGFVRVVRKAIGGNGQDTQYAGGSVIRPYHFADAARSANAPYRFAAEMAPFPVNAARRAASSGGCVRFIQHGCTEIWYNMW